MLKYASFVVEQSICTKTCNKVLNLSDSFLVNFFPAIKPLGTFLCKWLSNLTKNRNLLVLAISDMFWLFISIHARAESS